MKLLWVIVAIVATTAAKDTRQVISREEDLLALPSIQTPDIPFSTSSTNRGILKLGNHGNNYPQENYAPAQNNYVPPSENSFVLPRNNYGVPQNFYVPPQNNYIPPNNDVSTQKPYVPTQNYYWTTQAPYVPTQTTFVTSKPVYTYPPQQNQNKWTQNSWNTPTTPVSVIKNEHYTGDNGSYRYEYQLTDGTHVGEEGWMANPNTENQSLVKKGWYSYVGTDGYTHLVTYWADHTGYHSSYKKYYQ